VGAALPISSLVITHPNPADLRNDPSVQAWHVSISGLGQRCDRLGDYYTTRVLKRHPQVATTVARAIDCDRVLAMNVASLDTFFERLQDCISRNSIDPSDMWNYDEKGFMTGLGEKKNELVISRVRVKTPQQMQQGNQEWVTLIECVSAMGIRLPAFYIYAEAAHYKGLHSNESIASETVVAYTDNGWTKDYVVLEWLQNHFNKSTMPSRQKKTRLLLCVNHSSHDNYEFYEHCLTNNIALLFCPTHATQILQPLDVGVFSPLDRYCGHEVDNWKALKPIHASLLKEDFLPMYERARMKGVAAHSIKAAWAKCGIRPFNTTRVTTNPHYTVLFRANPKSPPL
jgi:hypothetical protein